MNDYNSMAEKDQEMITSFYHDYVKAAEIFAVKKNLLKKFIDGKINVETLNKKYPGNFGYAGLADGNSYGYKINICVVCGKPFVTGRKSDKFCPSTDKEGELTCTKETYRDKLKKERKEQRDLRVALKEKIKTESLDELYRRVSSGELTAAEFKQALVDL